MICSVLALFFWTLLSPVGLSAQETKAGPEKAEELKARIQRGETVAIREAGRSGNKDFIPLLRPLLKWAKDKEKNPSRYDAAAAAQLALARLGDNESLLQIRCEAEFGSGFMRDDVLRDKLPFVRGWFSFQILRDLIEDKPQQKALLRDAPSDSFPLRAKDVALEILHGLVENPPAPRPSGLRMQILAPELDEYRRAWREWFRVNEQDLWKLEPTGEGVETSEKVCKGVLKRDPFIGDYVRR